MRAVLPGLTRRPGSPAASSRHKRAILLGSVLVLAAFLVVAWLPGAVLFRVPWFDRPRRAQLAAEERSTGRSCSASSGSLAWCSALAAAHRYSFRALLIADGLTARGRSRRRRGSICRLGPSARRPELAALIPLALVILSGWRFLPPSEYVIGGKDPGRLPQRRRPDRAAGRTARRRTRPWRRFPPSRALFFPPDVNRPDYLSLRFMGFYVLDPDTGAVVSQFQHVFPASIAIGYGLDGLTGARRAVVACAHARRARAVFRRRAAVRAPAAAAAATLLALNVIEVWFARYPNVEIVMQALLFAALLAKRARTWTAIRSSRRSPGCCSVCCSSCASNALVVVAVIAAQALGLRRADQRVHWTFWPALALPASSLRVVLVGPMRAYFELPLAFLARLPWGVYAALRRRLVALLAIVVSAHRSAWTATRVAPDSCRASLALIVTLLALYALRFRHPGGRLADYDAYALRTFAIFYLTVPGAHRGAHRLRGDWRGGRSGATRRSPHAHGVRLFFFYKIRIVPEHFWAARRFLPIILPGRAAARGGRGARRASAAGWRLLRAIRGPIGVVFLALLAVQYARAARPVVDHVEYAGIIPRLEQLAARDRRRRPADRRVARTRLRRARPRAAAGLHLRAQRAGAVVAGARQADVRGVPRVGARALPARPVPRRRRHRPAVVAVVASRPIASERFQVPEYESRPESPTRTSCGGRSSTTASTRSARRRRRPAVRSRHRRQRRPERRPLPRQGARPKGTRSAGRSASRSSSSTGFGRRIGRWRCG